MNMEWMSQWRALAEPPGAAEPAGHAFVIQVEPDLAAAERINVGVAVVGSDGRRLTRMLVDFGRVQCFYGAEVAELVETLVDFARAAALSGAPAPGPSVLFTAPQPFFGVTAEQYLDQLFERVVPAARPQRQRQERDQLRDTDALWREVGNALRLRLPQRAEEILANPPTTVVETSRGPRAVCVPLTPRGAAGALESADFSIEVTKRKLMTALLDVQTAAEARQLDRLGLFIARPRRARREADLRAIDQAIDFVACRVPRQCRVEVEVESDRLAAHIIDWAQLDAA
jgi:hypothetical protein